MVVKQFGWEVAVEAFSRIGYVIGLRVLANFRFVDFTV